MSELKRTQLYEAHLAAGGQHCERQHQSGNHIPIHSFPPLLMPGGSGISCRFLDCFRFSW